MPKRSNQFQRLILLINNCLAGNAEVQESAMLQDKISGEFREVDILITTKSSSYDVFIAFEVIARSRKADTPWVESMYSKHSSLASDKLILVSEKGFTSTALTKAKFYGIETITIENALSADWKVAVELTAQGFFEITNFKYSCSVIYQFENGDLEQIETPTNLSVSIQNNIITLDEMVRNILNLQETKDAIYPRILHMNERQFWFSYSDSKGLWSMDIKGRKGLAIEVRVGLDVDHKRTPVEFSTGKYRDATFVTGTSTYSPNELQFVLLKKSDGSNEGSVINAFGVKNLISSTSN